MAKKMKRVHSVAETILGVRPSTTEMLSMISKDSKNVVTLENIEVIPAVPTIFSSFNRAVVLKGAPCNSTWVVHGPPAGGKSAFAVGICNSFVKAGHVAAYIDAEFALDKKWITALQAMQSGILYHQPESLEDAFETTDIWIGNFADAKKKGDIPPDTKFAICVDTIHKMACKKEIAELRSGTSTNGRVKHGSENINKGWGMQRANMITTWLDYLTPLVSKHGISFIALAHEKEVRSDSWGPPEYKVKGGGSLIYEAMVRIRIEQGKRIYVGSEKYKTLVGQEHRGHVLKNKVGHPLEYFSFYTSNGKGDVPSGFDTIREAMNECSYRNLFIKSGAWIYLPYDKSKKFMGEEKLRNYFIENPEAFNEFVEYLNEELCSPDEYQYSDKLEDEDNNKESVENEDIENEIANDGDNT